MPGGIRHPCASCVLLGERHREEQRRQFKRETDKEKVGKKGDLSEACVRGIPCWCQFHFSSSMLRSTSLPQRENIPTASNTKRTREKEETEVIESTRVDRTAKAER